LKRNKKWDGADIRKYNGTDDHDFVGLDAPFPNMPLWDRVLGSQLAVLLGLKKETDLCAAQTWRE